ncbi:MAG TPA: P-loop NTPase [Myxococcaceae bacterium]|nr:P-loop NTPase [Myxococcaceae bacterium]
MESSVPKGVAGTPHPHGAAPKEKLPGIRHVIAVASGKGGVGKSTVSVNLALALQQAGAQTGLIDADILGPSIPVMLGVPRGQPPAVNTEGRAIPTQPYGLRVISMGMLTGDDAPAILRGPMVTKYLQMFLGGVAWGKLDYLILDLPPGTGDTQLTLAQSTPLSGAVIVTTPQDVSLAIARRGLRMFEKVQVPILGIVENMSTFICPHCGERTDIFRHGGGAQMSKDLGVPFLGEIPLDANIVTSGDEGRPILVSHPDSAASQAYRAIAKRLSGQLDASVSAVLDSFVWTWDDARNTPGWFDDAVVANGSQTTPIGFGRRDPRTLSVLWQDGRRDDLDVRDLRLACMCALCVQEMSGKKMLDPKTVRTDVTPRTITSVGTYAITIAWNDGHGSGIYSFEHLRSLGASAKARASYDV